MGNPLEQHSTEKLQSLQKALRSIIGVIAGVSVIYVGVLIYFAVSGKWDQTKSLSIVPLLCMMVVTLPSFINLGVIGKELAKRRGEV